MSVLSHRMGWFSFDVLSRVQGAPQVTPHKKDVNLICYAQEMLRYQHSTCSASDKNGQIADSLRYPSAMPYHNNVLGKRALPTIPLGVARITQTEDDFVRNVRTQEDIWRNSYCISQVPRAIEGSQLKNRCSRAGVSKLQPTSGPNPTCHLHLHSP